MMRHIAQHIKALISYTATSSPSPFELVRSGPRFQERGACLRATTGGRPRRSQRPRSGGSGPRLIARQPKFRSTVPVPAIAIGKGNFNSIVTPQRYTVILGR